MTGGAEAHIVLLLLITSQPKKKFFKKNISHGKKQAFHNISFAQIFFYQKQSILQEFLLPDLP